MELKDLKTCIDNRDISALRRLKPDSIVLHITAPDTQGMFFTTQFTSLQYALWKMNNVTDRIEEFIAFFDELVVILGNDINYTGSKNFNCLYYAIQYGVDYRIIEHIVKKYPDTVNFVNTNSIIPPKVLFDQLHIAVTTKNLEVVKLLVDNEVNTNRTYLGKYTICHVIINEMRTLSNSYEMLKYIIENNKPNRFNANAVNIEGNNLLHMLTPALVTSFLSDLKPIAVLLVNNRVSTTHKNKNNRDPLTYMLEHPSFHIFNFDTVEEEQYRDLIIALISVGNITPNLYYNVFGNRILRFNYLKPVLERILELNPYINNTDNQVLALLDMWVDVDCGETVANEIIDNDDEETKKQKLKKKTKAQQEIFMLFMSHGAKIRPGFKFRERCDVSIWFAKQYPIVLNSIAIMSVKTLPRIGRWSQLSEVDSGVIIKLLNLMQESDKN